MTTRFHIFLDYSDDYPFPGILVPQEAYHSPVAFDAHSTIRFEENGRPGMLLSNALNQNFNGLRDSTFTPVVTTTSTRIAMRILWPGYEQWSHNVHVYDHTTSTRPYTLAKLAHVTAEIVKKFLENMAQVRSTEPRPDWWVSSVSFESLYLLELRHVSSGSWQPVLCRVV